MPQSILSDNYYNQVGLKIFHYNEEAVLQFESKMRVRILLSVNPDIEEPPYPVAAAFDKIAALQTAIDILLSPPAREQYDARLAMSLQAEAKTLLQATNLLPENDVALIEHNYFLILSLLQLIPEDKHTSSYHEQMTQILHKFVLLYERSQQQDKYYYFSKQILGYANKNLLPEQLAKNSLVYSSIYINVILFSMRENDMSYANEQIRLFIISEISLGKDEVSVFEKYQRLFLRLITLKGKETLFVKINKLAVYFFAAENVKEVEKKIFDQGIDVVANVARLVKEVQLNGTKEEIYLLQQILTLLAAKNKYENFPNNAFKSRIDSNSIDLHIEEWKRQLHTRSSQFEFGGLLFCDANTSTKDDTPQPQSSNSSGSFRM